MGLRTGFMTPTTCLILWYADASLQSSCYRHHSAHLLACASKWRNTCIASALASMQGMGVHAYAESAVRPKHTSLHGSDPDEVLDQTIQPTSGCMCRGPTIARWDWSCKSEVGEHSGHYLDSQIKSRGDHFQVVEQIIAGLIRCAKDNVERGTCTT